MKLDPLQRSVKAAYRASASGQLDVLLADERRWKSKETMATNKLRACRERINDFTRKLASEKDGVKPND
jgi:hypothetical protein